MKTHFTKENIQMADSTPMYLAKRNENICPLTDLYTHIHSNSNLNSQTGSNPNGHKQMNELNKL